MKIYEKQERPMRIVVLVSGGGTNLQAILDAIDSGAIRDTEVCGVISNNAGVYALERAAAKNIPTLVVRPKDYEERAQFEEAYQAAAESFSPDLIVLAGCLVVIPEKMVRAFENRIINIHPALIPSFCGTGYYGLRVHEAVLERGARVTGATVHVVDAGTDTGPILLQKAVYVQNGDTPQILQRRVMEEAEWKLLPETIRLIAEGRVSIEEGRAVIEDYCYGDIG